MPRKRCRDIMLGLLSAAPSVGSVIWRSGMNGAGGIPFSREVGMPLSLDEARAVVRGAETGEMGTAEGHLVPFFAGYGNANVPTSRENGIRAHRNQTFAAIHAPGAKRLLHISSPIGAVTGTGLDQPTAVWPEYGAEAGPLSLSAGAYERRLPRLLGVFIAPTTIMGPVTRLRQ